MDGVGTSIIGRPRPLPIHRRAEPAGRETYTVICEEPYYLPLIGMASTSNEATIRLQVPMGNLLTADAMRHLMDAQAARWAS